MNFLFNTLSELILGVAKGASTIVHLYFLNQKYPNH